MALWRSAWCRYQQCGRGNCFFGVALTDSCGLRQFSSVPEENVADDRAELCRKLIQSRDREIRALKMALEARKAENRATFMFNRRMKIDVNSLKSEAEELQGLRKALVAQEQENMRLTEINERLQAEVETLKNGLAAAMVITDALRDSPADDSAAVNNFTAESPAPEQNLETGSCRDREEAEESCSPSTLVVTPALDELVHPWQEWTIFIRHLKDNSHFTTSDATAMTNEDKVKAAIMNFCKMHKSIVGRLSQEDLVVFGAFGCPSVDRRVVTSGKKLRQYLNLAETDVCKFCSISNTCSRAHFQCASVEITIESSDVLWLLLHFGLDAVNKPAERRPLPEHIETTIRSLLLQVVYLAENPEATLKAQEAKTQLQPGDWRCASCKALNVSGSGLCRACGTACGQDTPKSGEWKCIKCKSKNSARNFLCQDCSAPRPPKELRWGDWTCSKCQSLNFARNKECFRCKVTQPPFKDRNMIGFNKNTTVEAPTRPAPFSLGATPWLMTREEKEASLKKQ